MIISPDTKKKMLDTYMGMQIIISEYLVDTIEDWSDCRSPSRAKRRLKRGFPQRLKTKSIPKKDAFVFDHKVMMHPELYEEFKRKLSDGRNNLETKVESKMEQSNFDMGRSQYSKWNPMFLLQNPYNNFFGIKRTST